jgi:hypothetical protein
MKQNLSSDGLITYHHETKTPNPWSLYGKSVIIQHSNCLNISRCAHIIMPSGHNASY